MMALPSPSASASSAFRKAVGDPLFPLGGLAAAQSTCTLTNTWAHDKLVLAMSANLSSSCSSGKRCSAAARLGDLVLARDHQAMELLQSCLEEDDEDVRLASAEALASIALRGIRQIVDVVQRARAQHQDARVRVVLVTACGKLMARGIVLGGAHALAESLTDSDAAVRAAALRSLPQLGSRTDTLVAAASSIADLSEAVRQTAADSLCQLVDGKASSESLDAATAVLSHCLTVDGDAGVCESAAETLRVVPKGHMVAIAALQTCLAHADPGVRAACCTSLGRLRLPADYETTRCIARLLNDEESVRRAAAGALERAAVQQDPLALLILVRTMDGRDSVVQGASERALAALRAASRHVPALALPNSTARKTVALAQLHLLDWRTRVAVAQLLAATLPGPRAQALHEVAANLKQVDRHWRTSLAIEAALKIEDFPKDFSTDVETTKALCALAELCQDSDVRVAKGSLQALEQYAQRCQLA